MSTRGDRNSGGVLSFYDDGTGERVFSGHPIQFYDDFLGADLVIPASGSEESGCSWSKKIVGAGPPTVAKNADVVNGVLTCALEATSEKQDAHLFQSDQRTFSVGQGLVWECRAKILVIPTGVGSIFWGVAGDWVDGPDAIALSAWFATRTADAGVIKAEVDDAITDQTETTGVTVTTAQWKIYRIDFSDLTSVKFYIDGVHVATTAKTYAATGASLVLQPFIGCYKASGVGVGSISVDYVRLSQNRA